MCVSSQSPLRTVFNRAVIRSASKVSSLMYGISLSKSPRRFFFRPLELSRREAGRLANAIIRSEAMVWISGPSQRGFGYLVLVREVVRRSTQYTRYQYSTSGQHDIRDVNTYLLGPADRGATLTRLVRMRYLFLCKERRKRNEIHQGHSLWDCRR